MSEYIVLISENLEMDCNYSTMFKADNGYSINLRENVCRTLEKYWGTFRLDETVRGFQNGNEIGVFSTECGEEFIVFSDYSVRRVEKC